MQFGGVQPKQELEYRNDMNIARFSGSVNNSLYLGNGAR